MYPFWVATYFPPPPFLVSSDPFFIDLFDIIRYMTKQDENLETDLKAEEKMNHKAKRRDQKKTKPMPVSGKEVFKLKKIKDQDEE